MDFDAFASVIAAKKLYPDAAIVLPGSMEKKVREFIETFNLSELILSPPLYIQNQEPDKERSGASKNHKISWDARIEQLIIVDTASPDRLGHLKDLLNKARLIIYDHHKGGELARTPGLRREVIVDDVGATATLFTEILQKKNIPITPLEATIFALGIYEETGSLTFPSTTERDLLAVAYLLKKGANLNIISNFLKPFINREELSLINEFLEGARDLLIENLRIKICKARKEEYPGEIAHLAHRIMEMDDLDGVILMLDIAGKSVLIARSNVPELDVSKLLERFGGGGHPSAASSTIKDKNIDELEIELIEALRTVVRPQRLARDIMSTHVITIQPTATIKEAERELTKYGINVLPIVKNGKLLGIISREIVEKALFHGFKLHKVIEFATLEPEVASPESPVSEVEKIMIEQNQRFMPVIKDGRLVGVITRTDILRVMYEGLMKRRRYGSGKIEGLEEAIGAPRFKNLSGLIKEHFPEDAFELLKKAGEVAQELHYNAYLVGGSVRDLLRRERNLDIDIVVEGDGIIFAKKLAERLYIMGLEKSLPKIVTHERFGTAKLFLSNYVIDIATARTEYYESPGALPKIESSSIKKDLYRRDFTINTLAIKLNSQEFGTLIDFFGGQKDIKEGTIRVLHSMSFVEDPTRALRAIRFSERFGFRISKHTEILMKQAVKMALFEKLSSERLHEELSLLFDEVSPLKAVERLHEYDLLKIISPSLRFDHTLKKRLKNLEEVLAWFTLSNIKETIKKDRLVIKILLLELPDNAVEKTLERISPNKRYTQEIVKDISSVKKILGALSKANKELYSDPVWLYNLLINHSLESILLTMSVTDSKEVQKLIVRYLTELKDIKPSITGKDLINMGLSPGPRFSKIFKQILHEKLRGNLKTPEEEKEYVVKHLRLVN